VRGAGTYCTPKEQKFTEGEAGGGQPIRLAYRKDPQKKDKSRQPLEAVLDRTVAGSGYP